MNAILLVLLAAPHIVLGTAWVTWARSPQKFPQPRWRSTLLFSGVLACSLNLCVFWAYVVWLRSHQTDMLWWKGRDEFELVSNFLTGFAVFAVAIGKGREAVAGLVFFAAVTGYLIWVVGHVGVL